MVGDSVRVAHPTLEREIQAAATAGKQFEFS